MTLFTPFRLGRIELANRIVMSPMTRSRAIGNVPSASMVTYYRLRASAGLILTEGVAPSPNGLGYARIPGVYTPEQVTAWRAVIDAVHADEGHIFLQLMHCGRIAHADNVPAGGRIVGPSAIAAPGTMWTDGKGMQPHPVPEAMTTADIRAAVEEFVHAAPSAIAAGADGVELHGANGYLIEQFLNTAANQRTDAYGGSVAGRIRFAVEVAEAVAKAIGADRVGMRLSPYGVNGGLVADPETAAVYTALAHQLARIGLVYVHVVDHAAIGAELKATIRATFTGAYILSGGYDGARAEADLTANHGDLVAFGRPFLANPHLVAKLRDHRELLVADRTTFFTPGEKGYLDYPVD
ncbi:MAG: alkene reductase [Proteobacteria bacterium]|nr:alkene reductase [Pseudomonadota bacterium]